MDMAIGSNPTSKLTPRALPISSRNFEPIKKDSVHCSSWLRRQFFGGTLSINTKSKISSAHLRNSIKCSVSEVTDTSTGTVYCTDVNHVVRVPVICLMICLRGFMIC